MASKKYIAIKLPPKKYVQKFRKSWLDRDELREWLVENPNAIHETKYGGYCIYCNTALPSKLYDLQSHAASRKHARNVTEKSRIEVRVERPPTPEKKDTKEDVFGQYIASELKLIKNQRVYEAVKWDIIHTLQSALLNEQSETEEYEA